VFMFRSLRCELPDFSCDRFSITSQIRSHFTRTASNVNILNVSTNVRKLSLFCAGPILWNLIPAHIKTLSTSLLLKNDHTKNQAIRNAGYET